LYNWHKLEVDIPALGDNRLTEITVADKKIGVLKKGAELFAFAALCPHAGAPLCEGWLDSLGRIVCPLHKYRFDPKNGRNTSGEGYKLFTYPIEHREDGVYVGLRA
jgi:nitrite reductase/ring-hydroxylating ferredoxin subunit